MTRAFATISFLAGMCLVLMACRPPALLVLDPASAYLMSMQGSDSSALKGKAHEAGFALSIVELSQDKSYADQVDQAMARLGPGPFPVVFAPLLGSDAKRLGTRMAEGRVHVMSTSFGTTIPLWSSFGKICGAFAKRQVARRITFCSLDGDAARAAELEAFRKAFELAAAHSSQLQVKLLPPGADDAAVQEMVAGLRSPVPDLTIFDTGTRDYNLISLLDNWTGHFMCPDSVGISSGFPLAVAGIEHNWAGKLAQILSDSDDGNPTNKEAWPAERLRLFNDYLDK